MTFGEAMVALEQGKYVRAKVWDSNRFIYKSKDILIDDSGKLLYLDFQKLMDEEWEEYGWSDIKEKTKTVIQVRCPYCFTYSCRETSDIHFMYCPHCGVKVVK